MTWEGQCTALTFYGSVHYAHSLPCCHDSCSACTSNSNVDNAYVKECMHKVCEAHGKSAAALEEGSANRSMSFEDKAMSELDEGLVRKSAEC